MACLRREDGSQTTEMGKIAAELAPLGVTVERRPLLGKAEEWHELLDKPQLTDGEKERVLAGLDEGYRDAAFAERDLVVLHPQMEGLDALLQQFADCHTHDDPEVRFIVDGMGTFGFVLPGGEQVAVDVGAEEYLAVPAGVEHWFELNEARRIKAVRYFTDRAGWVPVYTQTKRRL